MVRNLNGYNNQVNQYLVDVFIFLSGMFWVPIMKRLWPKISYCLSKKGTFMFATLKLYGAVIGRPRISAVWSEMIAADLFTAFREIKSNEYCSRRIWVRDSVTHFCLWAAVILPLKYLGNSGEGIRARRRYWDNLGLTRATKEIK
ncbi:uncharacterized protein LOC143897909 isoform X1 [Temnothorax americanus]|uniref:uncharacterized protein LOC143897909 isoform X1 n=1 Tax=Temnothorax americanus TaxID=1964332 RepID=UPI004069557A